MNAVTPLPSIAVLADIHANVWALDAVLRDAKQRGIQTFLNLGDILYGALKPRETYERLRNERIALTIRGNQDRQIYEATANELAGNPTLAYVVEDLGPEPIQWMRELPPCAAFGDEIFLCHGTPSSDLVYLLEDVRHGHPVVRPESEIVQLIGAVRQPVILCGHTHIPRIVQLASGQIVVNPGSVGLPAYSDDQPVQHSMETHSPHASYAVLEKDMHGWSVSLRRVAYDHDLPARQAKALGRDDWARAIATGRTT